MTNPTIPENGLDVSDEMVEAASDGFRSVLPVKYDPAGPHPRDAIRAALEAALARRLPPADNAAAWIIEHKSFPTELELYRAGGMEPITEADKASGFTCRLLYTTATPSYAEGRAAILREAANIARFAQSQWQAGGNEAEAGACGGVAHVIEALIGAAL
jgi:hypothetical protein